MLFYTPPYLLLFLPLATLVYSWLRTRFRPPWAQSWLIAASLVFYAYGDAKHLPLLLLSILFNWGIAHRMMAQTDRFRRGAYLWIGITVNVVLLFVFKYVQFVVSTLAFLHGPHLTVPHWGFPLGISFFTLTQIMYLADAYPKPPTSPAALRIYRGLLKPLSLLEHATIVSLFPTVTSGPLLRVRSVLPQLQKYTLAEPPSAAACRGIYLFAIGLAKKLVLADCFAAVADVGFGPMLSNQSFSFLESWVFCVAALLHVYFDFSGYSDMAVGAGWMLGIDLPQNFDGPLQSRSISEFWKRWHITLSNFITDFLYTPLLRSLGKPTLVTSALATVLAMTIAGLWHGPSWTFVAWGLVHGLALSLNQLWRRLNLGMPDWLGRVLTLLFVTSSIAFFRAPDLHKAIHMISGLLPSGSVFSIENLRGALPIPLAVVGPAAAAGVIIALFARTSLEYARDFRPSTYRALVTAALLLMAAFFMNSAPPRVFVYSSF